MFDPISNKLAEESKQAINDITVSQPTGNNIYNPEESTQGIMLQPDGSTTSNSAYTVSGYMPISEPGNLYASRTSGSHAVVRSYAFYDKDKTWISGDGNTSGFSNPINVPDNARYVRVTHGASVDYQVEIGSGITAYEPYKEGRILKEEKIPIRETTPDKVTFFEKVPGTRNLFNPNDPDYATGTYVNSTDGTLTANPNYNTTGYIEVVEGADVFASRNAGSYVIVRAYGIYDENKTFIEGFSDSGGYSGAIPIPQGGKFIRISHGAPSAEYQIEFGSTYTDYVPYQTKYLLKDTEIKKEVNNPWRNKLVVFNGDSITFGANAGYPETITPYPEIVARTLEMPFLNFAIGGSTIAENSSTPTDRDPIVNRYQNMNDLADLVVIAAGTNDWQYDWTPLGDMNSRDKNTFYGALHTLCLGLMEKYMGKQILFMTPIKREASVYPNQEDVNANGKTLGEYGEIIKEVCGYYGIPVLDMYNESMLNPHIESHKTAFIPDGSHPNKAGHEIMSRRVTGYLRQLN